VERSLGNEERLALQFSEYAFGGYNSISNSAVPCLCELLIVCL
jgi:hypothetical protein